MRDTPLTDAAIVGEFGDNNVPMVTADFARKLERDLAFCKELIRDQAAIIEEWYSDESYPF